MDGENIMRNLHDQDPARIAEQVTESIRIAYRDGSFIVELLHRTPGHDKAKWTPSVACDTIDQARNAAKTMTDQDEGPPMRWAKIA